MTQTNSPSYANDSEPKNAGPKGVSASDLAPRRVDVTITYLEQTTPPVRAPLIFRGGSVAILRVEQPPLHYYRYLYRLVGDPYKWVSRRQLNDDQLRETIHAPHVRIFALMVNGSPAGFAEFDEQHKDHIALKFFGLAPEWIGKGLGRYFLTNVLDIAWANGPKSIRLETCSLDNKAALPLYQKVGFKIYDRRDGVVELID